VHERIRNRRTNFIEQQVASLISRFGLLAVEALVVRNMVKNPKLAKSLVDTSWSMFFTHLLDKAEEAGRAVVRVNPAYTSQTCSACGHRQPMPLWVRVYECPQCGLVIHRDHNGSKNILQAGLQACGRAGRVVVRRCASMALAGVPSVTRAKVTKAPPYSRSERDEGTVAWWVKGN
jgi:putative transposase